MRCPCLVIQKEKAEIIRKTLKKIDKLHEELKVRREGSHVYFPLKAPVHINGCISDEADFERVKRKSYDDVLRDHGIHIDMRSIDFIGHVAIIRLKEDVFIEELADAILKTNKRIKTVCIDRGVRDDHRVRDLEIVRGERTLETVHVEYGVRMKMDISKVYFSPRLARERVRVAEQIEDNDIVIDMFAGVAPFDLIISKFSHPKRLYAIDANPYAVKYAEENIRLNSVVHLIEVIEGNAKKVIPCLPDAQHIIMNLPHNSFKFLSCALKKGTCIHYYEILKKEKIKERIKEIKALGGKEGYYIDVANVRTVGSYSPSKVRTGIDLHIKQL